jgi:hypothetical protein
VSFTLAHRLALSLSSGKQNLVKPVHFSYQKSRQVMSYASVAKPQFAERPNPVFPVAGIFICPDAKPHVG